MPVTLLAATTDADQSASYTIKSYRTTMPVVFVCPGLAGAEVGTLQYQDVAGSWHDYYVDGTLQVCSATNTGLAVYGPGIYRIDKDATAGATSVEVQTGYTP